MREKSIQIFIMIKHQKKVLILFIYLSVVLIDSVFKMVKGHCPQVSLKECEYIVTEKNWLIFLMKT